MIQLFENQLFDNFGLFTFVILGFNNYEMFASISGRSKKREQFCWSNGNRSIWTLHSLSKFTVDSHEQEPSLCSSTHVLKKLVCPAWKTLLSAQEGKKNEIRKELSMLRNRKTKEISAKHTTWCFFWKFHIDPDFSAVIYYYLLVVKNYIRDPYLLRTDVDTIKTTKFVFVP